MRSDSRRRIVAKLVAEAEAENGSEEIADPTSEESVSPAVMTPESIVVNGTVGPAMIHFQVGDVRRLDIEGSTPVSGAPTLIIFPTVLSDSNGEPTFPKIPGVPPFCLILSPEVTLRLLSLGIDDLADHFRGKYLSVSGNIERQRQDPPLTGELYRVWVNSIEQLIRIVKS